MRSQHEISISHLREIENFIDSHFIALANIIIIITLWSLIFYNPKSSDFHFSPQKFPFVTRTDYTVAALDITIPTCSYTCDVIITLLLSSPLSDKRNQFSLIVCIIVRKFKGIV